MIIDRIFIKAMLLHDSFRRDVTFSLGIMLHVDVGQMAEKEKLDFIYKLEKPLYTEYWEYRVVIGYLVKLIEM